MKGPLPPMQPVRLSWLGLFVVCLALALGGLLVGDWRLTHDNFNQFLTFRHFVGTEWGMGRFPWWNPWINLGYPFAADPQSGAWYPLVWLFSWFSVYTPRILALEWVLHVAIGGAGMSWWLRRGWNIPPSIAWTWGCTFALSGFFVGTAQILPFVIAGAWTPWALGSFHALMRKPNTAAALRLSLVMAMMLLGGYPSFAYNAVLIMAVWGVLRLASSRFNSHDLRVVPWLGLSAIITASLSFGFLFDFLMEYGSLSRANPEKVTDLDPCIWSTVSWFSMLLPSAASLPLEWLGTDRSHVNGFIGWIPFLILIFGWRNSSRRERFIVGGLCAFAVLMALGPAGGIHPVLSKLVPGMGLFRHTAQYRLYALMLCLIASAVVLQRQGSRIPWRRIALAFSGLALLGCAVAWFGGSPPPWHVLLDWGPQTKPGVDLSIPVLAAPWALFCLVLGLTGLLLMRAVKAGGLGWMMGTQLATMVWATWLVFGTTIAVPVPFGALSNHLRRGAEQPWSGDPLIVSEIPAGREIGLWRNAPMVLKQPSHEGYNPFQTASFEAYAQSTSYHSLGGHPFVWFEPSDAPCTLRVLRFEPQNVEAQLTCSESDPVNVVWAQNYNDRWTVQSGDTSLSLERWEEALMSCTIASPIPGRAATLQWQYDPGPLRWAARWMLVAWLGVVGAVLQRLSRGVRKRASRSAH